MVPYGNWAMPSSGPVGSRRDTSPEGSLKKGHFPPNRGEGRRDTGVCSTLGSRRDTSPFGRREKGRSPPNRGGGTGHSPVPGGELKV